MSTVTICKKCGRILAYELDNEPTREGYVTCKQCEKGQGEDEYPAKGPAGN